MLIRVGNCGLVWWEESQIISSADTCQEKKQSWRFWYWNCKPGLEYMHSLHLLSPLAMLSLLYSNIINAVSATSREQTWTYTEEEKGRLGQGIAKCNKYIQVEQTSESLQNKEVLQAVFVLNIFRFSTGISSKKFMVSMCSCPMSYPLLGIWEWNSSIFSPFYTLHVPISSTVKTFI